MNALTRAPNAITAGALATLEHWLSMAQGAFSENTLRAWRADWESRGVTRGDVRAGINPSPGRTHAFDGRPWMASPGLRAARIAKRNAAGKTPVPQAAAITPCRSAPRVMGITVVSAFSLA